MSFIARDVMHCCTLYSSVTRIQSVSRGVSVHSIIPSITRLMRYQMRCDEMERAELLVSGIKMGRKDLCGVKIG